MNIPNTLSLVRMLLIPAFVVTFFMADGQGLVDPMRLLSAGILVISGLTDLLDGYIARTYRQITELGKILDPLADKLTQAAICICITIREPLFLIALIPFVLKEGLSLVAGILLIKNKIRIPPSRWYGKIATFVFYGVTILLIAFGGQVPKEGIIAAGIAVCVLLIFSLMMYVPVYLEARTEASKSREEMTT